MEEASTLRRRRSWVIYDKQILLTQARSKDYIIIQIKCLDTINNNNRFKTDWNRFEFVRNSKAFSKSSNICLTNILSRAFLVHDHENPVLGMNERVFRILTKHLPGQSLNHIQK